jgi:hypothetical protein
MFWERLQRCSGWLHSGSVFVKVQGRHGYVLYHLMQISSKLHPKVGLGTHGMMMDTIRLVSIGNINAISSQATAREIAFKIFPKDVSW